MAINKILRLALLDRFNTQVEASVAMGIDQGCISVLVHGHRLPTAAEMGKFRKHFPEAELKKFFGKAAVADGEKTVSR